MKFNYSEELAHKKAEINQAIDRYHSTMTFMVTTTIAILSFGVSVRSPIISLFALVANILLWKKAALYKGVMAQHSAYCQVFLENDESGFYWETINHRLSNKEKNPKSKKTVNSYIEWEAIGINAICEIITILLIGFSSVDFSEWSLIEFSKQIALFSWIQFIFILISLVIFFWSCITIILSKSVHQWREYWLREFEQAKADIEKSEARTNCKAEQL